MATSNTEALNLKITPDLKSALERYASRHGLTLAATVRVALNAGLKALQDN